ncbi:class I SAM-dependent methyltransferase [Streptomyces sp. NBC_00343]|uniref:class I SAM-dependent methyltransferase n=1 Tax=Streptomyces sp. NBC_00343 TaxID=2975719 RepID=UPI002E2BBD85|nr:class I SAM-dependent methyltransferase [Streptomyces sp. NBC_00343]
MTTHPAPAVTRQSLLETLQAFKRTSLLRAAVELGVYDALAAGPLDAPRLADAVGADPRALRILLGAAAATGLLDTVTGTVTGGDHGGDRYALPEGAADLLVSTSPQYAGHALKVNVSDWEWEAMRDLAAVVRKGGTLLAPDATDEDFTYWTDFAADGTFVTRAAAAALVEDTRAWATGLRQPRVLDVGCGHALFGLEFARQHPHAVVRALDRPDVLVQARAHAERMGLSDRVGFIEGDAFTTGLDGPYDLVIAANMLPMFPRDQGTGLLRRLAGVLRPGGRLATVGFSVDGGPPADEHAAHLLSLLMLISTPGGEAHSLETTRRMLADAGLAELSSRRVGPLPVHVVTAEPLVATTAGLQEGTSR